MKNLLLSLGLCLGLTGCVSPQTRIIEDPTKYKAAILVAKPSSTLEKLAQPFLGIYKNAIVDDLRRELNVGTYEIDYSTTKEEFEQVLLDDSIQVVVVAGHGTWSDWCVGGEGIDESYLKWFAETNHVKKKKFLVKHTCGTNNVWFNKYDPEKVLPFLEELKALECRDVEFRDGMIVYFPVNKYLKNLFDNLVSQKYGRSKDLTKLIDEVTRAGCTFESYSCLSYLYCDVRGLPENVGEEIHDFVEANKSLRFDHLRDLFDAQDLLREQIERRFSDYSSRFKFDDITSINLFSVEGESYRQEGLRLRQEYEQAQIEFYDRVNSDQDILEKFDEEFNKYAEKYDFDSLKTVNGGKILFWDIPYQSKIDDIINRADKEALIEHAKPHQFGECIAERVIGWDRITYPWDFIFNPLAK